MSYWLRPHSRRRRVLLRRVLVALALVVVGAAIVGSAVPALGDQGPGIPLFPGIAGGGEPEQGPALGGGPQASLRLASDFLTGRAWLLANGLDPVLALGTKDEARGPLLSGSGSPPGQGAGPGGAAQVPYRDPSAKFSRNVLLSDDLGQYPYQTEPHVAVNPKDPDNIIVGLIDFNFPSMVTYSSIDGGATWQGPAMAKYPRTQLASAGDPVVGFDRQGNAYYGYISLDLEDFRIGPVVGEAEVSSISISRSKDAGQTWENPVETSRSGIRSRTLPSEDGRARGEVEFGFLDKPWMTIGPNPKDPSKDIVYVSYTRFISRYNLFWIDELPFLGSPALETVIEVVRSEDGGATWSKPIEVSPRALFVILSGEPSVSPPAQEGQFPESIRQVVQGSSVAVTPDGTAYVAWLDSTRDGSFEGLAEIYVSRSEDGGRTYSRPALVTSFLEPNFQPRTSNFRFWATAFPRLATGPKGELYLLHGGIPATNPEDDGDIFFLRSTDKGRTWTRRKRVNDDTSDRVQFFSDIAAGPDGKLHAMWGDMRDDTEQLRYHIYYASSDDGGDTWSVNSRVSDFASNPNRSFPGGRFIGDYFSIAATKDDVYLVWADARLGEFGGANQKIGFARRRLMPTPSIFISPPRGPAGKDVVIQGFNFQPEKDIFIEVAGAIVSTTRTNEEGRFNTGVFVPISGQGAHRVQAIDASGNVASSSYFMDFGFDNIQKITGQIDTLDKGLQGLQQRMEQSAGQVPPSLMAEVQAIQKTLQELKAAQQTSGRESPSWPFLAVAAALVLLTLIGATLVVALRRPRQPTESPR